MEKVRQFKNLLHKKIGEKIPIQTEWGVVGSVDWENKTAIVKVDDLDYDDVLLGLGNEYRKPVEGTKCLIGIIENKEGC